jgi:hypothetical protein
MFAGPRPGDLGDAEAGPGSTSTRRFSMTALRCVLAVALLAFGLYVAVGDGTGAAYAQKAGRKGGKGGKDTRPVDKRPLAILIGQLRQTHAVLTAADGVYGGHRAKALKHINAAIGPLQAEMRARGLKATSKHQGDVPTVVSHALLVQAGKDLEVIAAELGRLKGSPRLVKAAKQVQMAHTELLLAVRYASGKP